MINSPTLSWANQSWDADTEQLNLHVDNTSRDEWDRLKDNLSTCQRLKTLTLANVSLTDCSGGSLSTGLKNKTSLQRLNFHLCQSVEEKGCRALSPVRENKLVMGLEFYAARKEKCDFAVELISSWIKHQKPWNTHSEFVLRNYALASGFRPFGDDTYGTICHEIALQRWNVTHISLIECNLRDRDISSLVQSLQRQTQVVSLNLSGNRIKYASTINALTELACLQTLVVLDNPFTGDKKTCAKVVAHPKSNTQSVIFWRHPTPQQRLIAACVEWKPLVTCFAFENHTQGSTLNRIAPIQTAPASLKLGDGSLLISKEPIIRDREWYTNQSPQWAISNWMHEFVSPFTGEMRQQDLLSTLSEFVQFKETSREMWNKFLIKHSITVPANGAINIATALAAIGLAATGVGIPFIIRPLSKLTTLAQNYKFLRSN